MKAKNLSAAPSCRADPRDQFAKPWRRLVTIDIPDLSRIPLLFHLIGDSLAQSY